MVDRSLLYFVYALALVIRLLPNIVFIAFGAPLFHRFRLVF